MPSSDFPPSDRRLRTCQRGDQHGRQDHSAIRALGSQLIHDFRKGRNVLLMLTKCGTTCMHTKQSARGCMHSYARSSGEQNEGGAVEILDMWLAAYHGCHWSHRMWV